MTKRSTKQALLLSVLSLILCVSMLIGSTFAWFTDSVTSTNNKIQAGTLQIDLELLDKETGNWNSIKSSKAALFNYEKWEPGYVEAKVLKVQNEGTLALKWVAQFVSQYELSILADAIDVYVLPSATAIGYPTRDLTGYENKGTLRSFLNTISQTTYGTLLAKDNVDGSGPDEAYLGIALKMREDAGNIYQGLDLGGSFDIKIFATQLNSETDSFDKDYDIKSEYDEVGVESVVPTATVAEYALANTPGYSEDPEVVWGGLGGFAPDYTVDADPKLEAAYEFICDHTGDEAAASDYANWYCDFFVKLDGDLGANQIFLGGNYGDFGWIGFHNGDMTLGANTYVPLLSLVGNPWTYTSVATYVGDFVCGVGDVNDALAGQTFTVELRLIDPDKVDTDDPEWWSQEKLTADKYIVVNSTTHTFVEGEYVTNAEDLQNALDNAEDGDTIVLGGDIDLTEGLVIGG